MNRAVLALSLLAALAAGAVAQETRTMQTDFEVGQTYRYRLTSVATVGGMDEATSTTAVAFHYDVLAADEATFTIGFEIDEIQIEDADGQPVELPAETQAMFEIVRGAIGALEVTYDRQWNVVGTKGLGQIVAGLLRQLPAPASDYAGEIGRVADEVLGPFTTALLQSSTREDTTWNLFQMGTVPADWTSVQYRSVPLFGTITREERVTGFDSAMGRDVVLVAQDQTIEFGGLAKVLGYGTQRVEATLGLFTNGMPASGTIATTMTMQGQTIENDIQIELTSIETGPTADEGPYAEALMALQSGDFDRAIALLGETLESEGDATGWYYLSRAWEAKGFDVSDNGTSTPESARCFIEAGTAFRKALEAGFEAESRDAQRLYYNEACGHALSGHADEAIRSLQAAIESGWADAEHMKQDPDLESIRALEPFRALVEKIEGKKTEEAKGEVAQLFAAHEPFEFTFERPDTAGTTHKLADLSGKVVIVDIWGTWCPPCRREIPHFIDLYKKYHDQGLEIVGINYEGVGEEEAKKKIDAFVAETGIPYPCVLGDEATKGQIADFQGFPTTLFIDRTGKVRLKLVDYQEQALLDEVVKTLLAE